MAKVVLRLVTEQEAASGVKVKERAKPVSQQTLAESVDAIALHRVRNDPSVGVGVKTNELYTPEEVAGLLRCHPASVRRWLGAGLLSGFKSIGGWKIRGSTILRLIDGV
jgi:hypothetical protein